MKMPWKSIQNNENALKHHENTWKSRLLQRFEARKGPPQLLQEHRQALLRPSTPWSLPARSPVRPQKSPPSSRSWSRSPSWRHIIDAIYIYIIFYSHYTLNPIHIYSYIILYRYYMTRCDMFLVLYMRTWAWMAHLLHVPHFIWVSKRFSAPHSLPPWPQQCLRPLLGQHGGLFPGIDQL